MTIVVRPSRALAAVCSVLAALVLSLPVFAGGPGGKTLADLAPAESFMTLSVDDWPKARAAFNTSTWGHLWEEQSVRDFVRALVVGGAEAVGRQGGEDWLAQQLKDVGLDLEDLKEPTGPAGVALFLSKPDAKAGKDKDDEADTRPVLHFFAVAEFGDSAEAMEGSIEKLIKDAVAKGHVKSDQEQVEGQAVHVVTRVKEEDGKKAGHKRHKPGDDEGDEEDFSPPDGPWNTDAVDSIRIVRVGGTIVMTTSKSTLESTIDRLSDRGGKDSETLASSKGYQAALAQHHKDIHASMIVVVTDLLRTSLSELMAERGPMAGAPFEGDALFKALGLSSIQAAGLGIRLDPEGGLVEQSIGVVAPEKTGLLAIVDSPMDSFQPPSFVGPETASLTMLSVRFDRVLDLVRAVFKAMPDQMQQAAAGQIQAAEGFLTPFLATLDRDVSVTNTYKLPLSADSQHTLVAIKIRDALGLANQITGFAPTIGLEPRDFQGNQIFEAKGPGGPPSIGIGGGYAFVGKVEDVENALRQASDPTSPKLASSPRFKAAAAQASPGANLYMYSDISQSMAWTYWSAQNADKIYDAQLEQWGLEEADRREAMESFSKALPEWQKKLPPLSVVLKHLGDTVLDLRPTPDGFRGRSLILRPTKD